MTNELMEFAAAGIGLVSAFLEVGTAVLMAWLAARRLSENGRSTVHEEEHIAQGDASPFRRFAGWPPRSRSRRRQGRGSKSA